jgi:dihydroorotase
MTSRLTIRRPDDWHLHLRDGAMLTGVLPETARHFARAIVMPNLVPPVVTGDDARAYRDRILAALPEGMAFEPLMTLYLTETTDPGDVAAAFAEGLVTAVKLYPAGATTNSASGVRDLGRVMPVLEKMAEIGLPLCIHGEVTTPEVDIFDREAVFLETVLEPLRRALPELKVTLEHITTADGVDYVAEADGDIAGTITTHHLMINRNHMLVGGIRPHYYCLPVAKRSTHQPRAARAPRSRAIRASSSAPTARRMWTRRRKPPAAARACSRPRTRSAASPMSSRRRTRSTGWRGSCRSTAPRATACRRTRTGSHWRSGRRPWRPRRRSRRARGRSRSSIPAIRCTGTS